MENTNFTKLYKIMLKLTVLQNRQTLNALVPNLDLYKDSQVMELAHALNTGVDLKKLSNPDLSSAQMREIREDEEFGTTLNNVNYIEYFNAKSLQR